MKSFFVLFVSFFLTFAMVAQNVDITFQVDMSEQTVNPNGVHVAGSFQAWDPAATPLVDMGNGIWSITVSILENTTVQYKYVNGDAWGFDESIPAECQVSGNREFVIGTTNETIPLVCFASCTSCPAVTGCTDPSASNYVSNASIDDGSCLYEVSFSIDMSQYAGVFTNPEVNGSWDGFLGGINILTDLELDNVFDGVVQLPLGTHEFKFALDNWNDSEVFDGNEICTVNTTGTWNREISVSGPGAYPLVCWNSCANCVPIASDIRITEVNTTDNLITLSNFGNASQDVGVYYLCNFPDYVQISTLVLTNGSPFVAPGGSVQYSWAAATGPNGECGLYSVNTFADPNAIVDYMQWVSGPQQRAGVAVTAGVWDDTSNYVQNDSPYSFIGGAGNYGSSFWSGTIPPPTFDITFQVDMNQVAVSPDGVHIAGNFNDPNGDASVINAALPQWDPAGIQLTDLNMDGVYEITLSLADGVDYEYKFINGNVWGQDEAVPAACQTNSNRLYSMNNSNEVLEAKCFASCDACPSPTSLVTFRVDLSETGMTPDGVGVATSVNGFVPTLNPLADMGNGIWEMAYEFNIGDLVEYRFANETGLTNHEIVPIECGVDDGNAVFNRTFTVPSESLELDLVCFGECSTCASSVVEVTFQVDLSLEPVSPDGVFIAGSFQSPSPWTPGIDVMTDAGGGIYTYTTSLPSGTNVEFKYFNGLTFAEAELVPIECGIDNGLGGNNRYHDVGFGNETLDLICFGSCIDCDIPPVNVTFVVDMSNQTIAPEGVHIAGSFQSWDPSSTPMTDMGGGLYSYTAPIAPNSLISYKFINGNVWGMDEAVPAECADGGNRSFQTLNSDATLPSVCFGECLVCNPPMVDVTFQVDMTLETIDAAGVHLAGSFQGWDPASTLMINQGNGTWSVTVTMIENTSFEYKFINGDTFLNEESVPGECATNSNRGYTAGVVNETLDLVCFSQCAVCGIPQVTISFKVDMANEVVSAEGVHLVGNFQGWDPSSTAMNYMGYGIYEYSVTLDGFSTYNYKFVNGDEFGEDEFVPAPCAVANGFGSNNRELITQNLDVALPIVCYEECQACIGCTNPFMLEFNPFAISDDGSCLTPLVLGCTYVNADNFNASANDDDGSCELTTANPCPEDLNMDGVVNAADLLSFLGVFGTPCN